MIKFPFTVKSYTRQFFSVHRGETRQNTPAPVPRHVPIDGRQRRTLHRRDEERLLESPKHAQEV